MQVSDYTDIASLLLDAEGGGGQAAREKQKDLHNGGAITLPPISLSMAEACYEERASKASTSY
jgi:hypothetical protein